jgi:metal transporter CNNM
LLNLLRIAVIHGALALTETIVSEVMIPWDEVFMIRLDAVLDSNLMTSIMASGYSRIPVYKGENRNNVCGLLLVKRLIIIDPDERRPVEPLVVVRY